MDMGITYLPEPGVGHQAKFRRHMMNPPARGITGGLWGGRAGEGPVQVVNRRNRKLFLQPKRCHVAGLGQAAAEAALKVARDAYAVKNQRKINNRRKHRRKADYRIARRLGKRSCQSSRPLRDGYKGT